MNIQSTRQGFQTPQKPAAIDGNSITLKETPIQDVFIGSEAYDGNEIAVKRKAPFAHQVVAAGGLIGALACVAKVGAYALDQPTLVGKITAAAFALGAAGVGYALADFGSGVFHHAIDNYPKKPDQAKPGELTWDTPIIGGMAAEFQVHHHFTRDLEQVPFVSNLYSGGQILVPALLAVAAFSQAPLLTAAAGSFLTGTFLTQGSHRWTHMPNPPAIGKFMQKVGLAQSKEDHFTHHKMPWSDHYCIVNGMWNPILTKTDFWRKMECAIYKVTGAEPNSWRDPGVRELALGEITKEEFLERRGLDAETFRDLVDKAGERDALQSRLKGREELNEFHAPK